MSEKTGSTTNLEDVSHLWQKVNTPGVARADWMIAVELADRLGHDLGGFGEGISEQRHLLVQVWWNVPFETSAPDVNVAPKGGYDVDLIVLG